MKVEYVEIPKLSGPSIMGWAWIWRTAVAESTHSYARRRDAVRGFERFCRAIEKARKA